MNLSPLPIQKFFDNNGRPLARGKLFTYQNGTSVKAATYRDAAGITPNTNPVELDFRGECRLWLDLSQAYTFVLSPATDSDPPTNPIWSANDISAALTLPSLTQVIIAPILNPRTAAEIAASVTPTNYAYPELNVKRYGAAGNFDPSTGAGTDDRLAIQDAINVAQQYTGGATVVFPQGRYYTGPNKFPHNGTTNPGTAQIMVGIGGTQNSATNITLQGYGAELYQGADGKMICIYEANNVRITGFKIYGYTGGVLGASRQNDTPISISNRSFNVRIDDCYITNSLGDCISIYGDLNQVATDRFSLNIEIDHCVLKERYGNGTPSISGGTKSRFAIAVIDVVGLDVHDNQIYGYIDLEPNLTTDHIVDVIIHDNRFRSGHVTAQSVIGTAFWFDEPIALSGGSVIEQGVAQVSVTTPITANVRVQNNNIEFGRISMGGDPNTMDLVSGNMFEAGQISVGTANASRTVIVDNTSHAPYTAEVAFIKLLSSLANSVISRNNALTSGSWDFCVDTDGAGADGGANTFEGNVCESGTNLGFAPATSSVVDYYAGTWTPVLTFATPGDLNVVYAALGQVGRYTRRYKSVEIPLFRTVLSTFTHSTAVGALQISGLPYPVLVSSAASWTGAVRWGGITKANYTDVTPKIESGATAITFSASGSGQPIGDVTAADMPSGGTPALIGRIVYEIAS